jgi:hypothetical protein
MESMRKIFGMNVLRTSAFALTCLALAGTGVMADAINSTTGTSTAAVTSGTVATTSTVAAAAAATPDKPVPVVVQGVNHTYSTSGTVMTDGITGTNVISVNPVASGSFSAPSAVGLGEFVVSTLPPGSQTVYNNTHFSFTYNPVSVAGIPLPAGATPVTITGVLNGTITGSQSSVKATFDTISSPVFSTKDGQFLSTLSILNNPLDLVPASAGGRTTIQAQVVTTSPSPAGDNNTPEPTTLAILATSMVGFGLRQRLRARKTA